MSLGTTFPRSFSREGGSPLQEGSRIMRYVFLLFLATTLSLVGGCGGGKGSPGGGEATHFAVSGPANIPSGTPFNFTVTALDAANNNVAGYSGTVHFASSDPHAQLPKDSTLVSGNGAFSATLTTAGNQMISATATASASITGSSHSINVGALAGAFPVE